MMHIRNFIFYFIVIITIEASCDVGVPSAKKEPLGISSVLIYPDKNAVKSGCFTPTLAVIEFDLINNFEVPILYPCPKDSFPIGLVSSYFLIDDFKKTRSTYTSTIMCECASQYTIIDTLYPGEKKKVNLLFQDYIVDSTAMVNSLYNYIVVTCSINITKKHTVSDFSTSVYKEILNNETTFYFTPIFDLDFANNKCKYLGSNIESILKKYENYREDTQIERYQIKEN